MRECEECREAFRAASTGRPAKYCSSSCRRKAWEREQIRKAVDAERERAEAAQQEAVVLAVARALAAERSGQFRSDESEKRLNETPPQARRPRRRSGMTASPMPLLPLDEDG